MNSNNARPRRAIDEIKLVLVDAGMDIDQLAGPVVEARGGEGLGRAAEILGDLQIRVGVGRVGQRQLREELLGWPLGVVRVDAEEGDLVAALLRERLEPRELEAAGAAPRGPLVDDDREAPQLAGALVERLGAAGEQLVRLRADLR
jgi:hypothetical protein